MRDKRFTQFGKLYYELLKTTLKSIKIDAADPEILSFIFHTFFFLVRTCCLPTMQLHHLQFAVSSSKSLDKCVLLFTLVKTFVYFCLLFRAFSDVILRRDKYRP